MKALTTKPGRIILISLCFAAMTAQAEQIEQTTPPPVVTAAKAESLGVIDTVKTELLQDLQQQLKDSITQQATSALSHVVQSVKAMLP